MCVCACVRERLVAKKMLFYHQGWSDGGRCGDLLDQEQRLLQDPQGFLTQGRVSIARVLWENAFNLS